MLKALVTADGGLTGAGYSAAVLIIVLLAAAAVFFCRRNSSTAKMTTQQLVTCAIALALAYVTSYIKVFKLPFGGSVTLFSMLFIALIGYWYGTKIGILTGLVYGIFQFLQEPYVLSLFQVGCDYVLAFGAMGLSGLFSKSKKHGLLKAYIIAILARGAFHALGGYLYWMDYMPENFPKALAALYPIIYNYSYILLEGAVTVALISIPAVSKALNQVKYLTTPVRSVKTVTR
ncbi:MAG: energy-coupled thiamine transporter ThiT [Eubacteriales bacterium]|nr:energy-coupled thiamine transporter ThiT [Eubacteriales bacterium]